MAHVGKGRSEDDPPSTEYLYRWQPYASEAHFRQHYGLSHLKDLYQRTANKGVGGLAAGPRQVMVYSRQSYGLSYKQQQTKCDLNRVVFWLK
jgi:hypothetical protein